MRTLVRDQEPRMHSDLHPLRRHALDRRAFLRGAATASAAGAAVYALGCGGDGSGSPTATAGPVQTPAATPAAGALTPYILTSEFVAREPSRFLVGLLDDNGDLVPNASIALQYFALGADGSTGTLRAEGQASYIELEVPESASGFGAELGEKVGFYGTGVTFDAAGRWAARISATPPGATDAVAVDAAFDVFEAYRIPALGTVPPASENDTFDTNPNTASLCSRDPACPLHDKVIADYLGRGRPLAVQFSTPAFCETRFCGPVLDVLLDEVPAYEDRVDFIHIEVWQDFQLQQYRAATREWNLPTEPITFFMRSDGTIASYLESVFSGGELTAALDALLA
jgi:hypothetical protein